ncbi:MAG: class I SAM-dependent methyltransferase [Eggerthellaceae bacterium]|nr:class I SAM-dependent methyltransferase [Eggerthellaceae bacterium]
MALDMTPTLQTTDWNEEWKHLQLVRGTADNVEFWNRRARTFGSETPSAYSVEFMHRAGVRSKESVMDMGCGTGNLAIPYASQGHHVIAADFSPAMLERLEHQANEIGLRNIDTCLLSWQEDWQKAGIEPNSVDVAIASRSITTDDMKDALLKLSRTARRRCCITLATSSSPHVDTRVLEACGVANTRGHDFQYAFNILLNEGFLPECSYIVSERKDTFDSQEDAFNHMEKMLIQALGNNETEALDAARRRLQTWLEYNLVKNEEAGASDNHHDTQKAFRLTYNRQFIWGFIAWDTKR